MDDGPESIWSRMGRFFRHEDEETLEKAITEARAEGEVAAEEESMLLGILRFDELQVQDVMTPRTDIDCVADDSTLADVAQVIINSGHSRIPVYKETRDNMIGIIHAKDLLRSLLDPSQQGHPAVEIMREPFFVPETKGIRDLLQEFRSRKLHIAIALDEYGGTSGLVSIEDVLEEIVGDIEDEHDAPREDDIRACGDGSYELTGRAWLEDLEGMGIALDSDEVDTIGGYLCLLAGHVPTPGESFRLQGWTFTVKEADQKLIRKILLSPDAPAPEAGDTTPAGDGSADASANNA